MLGSLENIHLISPLDYLPFVKLMELSYFILTDSGGIQEEAPSLNIPVLVLREVTERTEVLETGAAKLIGIKKENMIKQISKLLTNPTQYEKMRHTKNPYGNGKSSLKISSLLLNLLAT